VRRRALPANTLASGFTLLELLLVAVILAAAAAVSIPRMVRDAERVTQAGQAQILQNLRKAMDAYLLSYADAIWTNTPIPVNPALPAAGIAYANPRAPTIAELTVRGQANAGLVAGATAIGGGQYRIAIAFVTDAAGVAVPAGCDAVAPPSCDLQATIWVDHRQYCGDARPRWRLVGRAGRGRSSAGCADRVGERNWRNISQSCRCTSRHRCHPRHLRSQLDREFCPARRHAADHVAQWTCR
jgi:prepilin-type N-terminal cleavage/methylation domain-containing protein